MKDWICWRCGYDTLTVSDQRCPRCDSSALITRRRMRDYVIANLAVSRMVRFERAMAADGWMRWTPAMEKKLDVSRWRTRWHSSGHYVRIRPALWWDDASYIAYQSGGPADMDWTEHDRIAAESERIENIRREY